MKYNAKKHWDDIFKTKEYNEFSWYQSNPKTSIDLILSTRPDENAGIIDIGGGDSNLVDKLLELGFKNISVLDISSNALERAKVRLGNRAKEIKWIVSDMREFKTIDKYDIWHDRAALHFLTSDEDINKYVKAVKKYLKPDGYLIVSTFSINGPKKCSGLDVKQYSADSMKQLFSDFELIKSFEEEHLTPWNSSQVFIYGVFRKKG